MAKSHAASATLNRLPNSVSNCVLTWTVAGDAAGTGAGSER